ncbi:hypothetical protein SCLCIDRAFT_185281 [Scleroderma citrinum Foug A]|uniref:Uncharacterized protein n=1 Tax=Scleroderma citrinum Foug A TaxID=1036808 RepID=A0A0C3D901_9AGAM|nr:hypothetical protein SCLCIDRAFT_185281 [Scleroderma citrinum Foug A]
MDHTTRLGYFCLPTYSSENAAYPERRAAEYSRRLLTGWCCLYFAIMSCGAIANIIVPLKTADSHKIISSSVANALATTLISRLMLNLRDPKVTNLKGSSLLPLSHANIVFKPGDSVRMSVTCHG